MLLYWSGVSMVSLNSWSQRKCQCGTSGNDVLHENFPLYGIIFALYIIELRLRQVTYWWTVLQFQLCQLVWQWTCCRERDICINLYNCAMHMLIGIWRNCLGQCSYMYRNRGPETDPWKEQVSTLTMTCNSWVLEVRVSITNKKRCERSRLWL